MDHMTKLSDLIKKYDLVDYEVSIVDKFDNIIFLNKILLKRFGFKNNDEILGCNLGSLVAQSGVKDPWRDQIFSHLNTNNGKPIETYSVGHGDYPIKISQQKLYLQEFGDVYLVFCRPISRTSKLNSIVLQTYYRRYNSFYIETQNFSGFELCNLQEKIITLLLCGYSMSDIATITNLSRSYVNKIIGDRICPLFGVSNCSSRFLVDNLIKNNLYCFASPSILLPSSKEVLLNQENILSDDLQLIYDLIRLNFTQSEIAREFNYSKSNIAKIIHTKILPAFGVNSIKKLRIISLI